MWIDVGLLAITGLAYLLSKRRYKDVFTPLLAYIVPWCGCLILFHLRFIEYDQLETKTILIIAASLLAFVSGCLAAGKPRLRNADSKLQGEQIDRERLELCIKVLLVLNAIGAAIFVLRMGASYGLSTYITDPEFIRGSGHEWSQQGPAAALMLLDYPLIVLSWIHFLMHYRRRWFTILGIISPIVQTFLRTDRISLTYTALTMFFIWVYIHGWRRLNRTLLLRMGMFGVILIGYFLLMGLILGKLVSSPVMSQMMDQRQLNVSSQAGLVLLSPYLYMTGSFPTLQQAMPDVQEFSWGTHTFFPVARLLNAVGLIREKPEAFDFDFYLVPIPFNTYTYLFTFYQDFGIPGMILMPFFLGWLETRLYFRILEAPTIANVAIGATFLCVNILSVFITLTSGLAIWYYFAVVALVSHWCTYRARRPGQSA